jgi:acyl-CoA thioesterase I
MRLASPVLALVVSASCLAQSPAPLYALAPSGHGENGDWAFFARYRQENAALRPDGARVVFIGDSLTESWAQEPFMKGRPHVVNRGISGQTALQMLVRFRADVIALGPRVVHIMAGTNDVAANNGPETDEEIEDAIQSMVELALAHHIQVILGSIPPAADYPWHRGLNPAPRIRRLNEWLQAYAQRSGVGYADYWSALATPGGAMQPGLSPDGVHPNAAGYRRMEQVCAAALRAALAAQARPVPSG